MSPGSRAAGRLALGCGSVAVLGAKLEEGAAQKLLGRASEYHSIIESFGATTTRPTNGANHLCTLLLCSSVAGEIAFRP